MWCMEKNKFEGKYSLFSYSKVYMNSLLKKGLKMRAENLYYDIYMYLKLKMKSNPGVIFETAFQSSQSEIFLVPLVLGGNVKEVPVAAHGRKKSVLVMLWLTRNVKKGYTAEKLAHMLLDACEGKGVVFKVKAEMFKNAVLNSHLCFMIFNKGSRRKSKDRYKFKNIYGY